MIFSSLFIFISHQSFYYVIGLGLFVWNILNYFACRTSNQRSLVNNVYISTSFHSVYSSFTHQFSTLPVFSSKLNANKRKQKKLNQSSELDIVFYSTYICVSMSKWFCLISWIYTFIISLSIPFSCAESSKKQAFANQVFISTFIRECISVPFRVGYAHWTWIRSHCNWVNGCAKKQYFTKCEQQIIYSMKSMSPKHTVANFDSKLWLWLQSDCCFRSLVNILILCINYAPSVCPISIDNCFAYISACPLKLVN